MEPRVLKAEPSDHARWYVAPPESLVLTSDEIISYSVRLLSPSVALGLRRLGLLLISSSTAAMSPSLNTVAVPISAVASAVVSIVVLPFSENAYDP